MGRNPLIRRFARAWDALQHRWPTGQSSPGAPPREVPGSSPPAPPPARSEVSERPWPPGAGRGGALPSSYLVNLMQLRRRVDLIRSVPGTERLPLRQQTRKLRNYRLAASHGVPVPQVHQVWPTVQSIDLADLPDSFVLKGDGGAGSAGVLPLHRVGRDEYRLVSTARRLSGEQVRETLASKRGVRPPFFAEEMLSSEDSHGLPDDIKVFACYGEVVHVMLRRVDEHGNLRRTRYRYVDAEGRDLGADITSGQAVDPSIPLPADLASILEVSAHLSRAVALPFVRVDVFETARGVVLGEVTRGPGGPQFYREDHDRRLGTAWDRAQCRLDADVQTGRPLHVIHGTRPAPNLYPAGHPSWEEREGAWAVVRLPCETWCLPG